MPIDSPKIENSQIIGGGIAPTGTILSFASEVAPDGWLVCDGQQVSRSTYAELYSVIGNRWGEGDGSSTFHLPDLRGRFLRGYDGGAGNDPDAAGRISSNSGGNTGDNVGSLQGDATKRPNSSFSGSTSISGNTDSAGGHNHQYYYSQGNTAGGYPVGLQGSDRSSSTSYQPDHTHGFSASTTTTIDSGGDNETRPLNANVSYIIKI